MSGLPWAISEKSGEPLPRGPLRAVRFVAGGGALFGEPARLGGRRGVGGLGGPSRVPRGRPDSAGESPFALFLGLLAEA